MANYLTYPFKVMRITQSYVGTTSHLPHTTGTPKDYPLDEGDKDGGRSPFYCPCDEVEIVRIYGVGNRGVNTIWVTSTSKVIFADGTSDYCTIQITHPNDSDIRGLRVGQKFKRGAIICYEGTDGATGNHIHHSIGKGKMKGTGWTPNSKGKYVLTTTNGAVKPENAYAIDEKFTKVVNKQGLPFKTLASVKKAYEKKKDTTTTKYPVGEYKVSKAEVLRVRTGAGTKYASKSYNQLSTSAKIRILELNKGKQADGYVKVMIFTVSNVEYNKEDKLHWGKTPSGWVALEYCKKI